MIVGGWVVREDIERVWEESEKWSVSVKPRKKVLARVEGEEGRKGVALDNIKLIEGATKSSGSGEEGRGMCAAQYM